MNDFPDLAQLSNLPLMESLYRSYLSDPQAVDSSWRLFFEGVDFASVLYKKGGEPAAGGSDLRIFLLIQAYRRYGHLKARFNPLQEFEKPREKGELDLEGLGFKKEELAETFPTFGFCGKKEAPLQEIVASLEKIYCGSIGFECMDLGDAKLEAWIQNQIESGSMGDLPFEEKQLILEHLNKSEIFESFIHTKYVGQKRFSLEGSETLIPMLAEILKRGSELSMEAFVIGMAHRGRLNVLANILNKPYSLVFQEFEDNLPLSFGGGGDVKYHKGFSSDMKMANGKSLHLYLAANSSCLESVDPIVLGQTRAIQSLLNDEERRRAGAILIHGDAALAGQGVVYESLEFCKLPGYKTGGTIHIALNNQIGYTTLPEEGRSTLYCTDIAKTFGAPVFHVNAEEPESCIFAARLAIEIRLKFQCDVFIDLNCYRKYGHNEGDEPSFTQPLHYRSIRSRKSIKEMYVEQLASQGIVEKQLAETLDASFRKTLGDALDQAKTASSVKPEPLFSSDVLLKPVETRVDASTIDQVAVAMNRVPDRFEIHPKLKKWTEERLNMAHSDPALPKIDWAMGEALAFGTLLWQGIPIRLCGQDSARGTFSQRHAIWWDQEKGAPYYPLAHLKQGQARFDVYNSPLSEFGSLGFEYGYSSIDPKTLVIWEAQYGDFVIGAEILIDHYLAAAEQKWDRYSSLTLLLPHGYEGAGPEHSSGRIERFLQLTAHNNMIVAYPTTPAQFFHLLRRQALRAAKKPLIVFTPKGLLRQSVCSSPLNALTLGSFEEVIDDPSAPVSPKKLIFCTGKLYYDFLADKSGFADAAIVRIEQLYPLHLQKLEKLFVKYKGVSAVYWAQEEPENMGAWETLSFSLRKIWPNIVYVGRERSGSAATGSLREHNQEQKSILDRLKK